MKRTLLFLSFLAWIGAAQADAVLDEARRLMAERNAPAAWALLEPLEKERAGDPQYDYLLGIAALDAGHPTRAVFALERVLAMEPNHPQARAEIARAYFVLGERRTAKQEFESVQKLGVPADAQATIQKYLSAIEDMGAGDRPSVFGYLELGSGYDSNVNAGPGAGSVAVPAFGGQIVTLNPVGIEKGSGFLSLAAGASLRYPLKPGIAVVAGLFGTTQSNWSAHDFDTADVSANLGLSFSQGRDSLTVALQGDRFFLDDARYRDAGGGLVQWTRVIDQANSVSAYGQYARLDYTGTQDIRDADRWVAGGAYGHAFAGTLEPITYFSGYLGTDDERNDGVPWLGDRFWGLRAGGQVSVARGTLLFGAASVERRYYGGPDPLFLLTRMDTQTDFRLGANYRLAESWMVTPLAAYTRNASNISIYEYDRWIVQVSVRREFY